MNLTNILTVGAGSCVGGVVRYLLSNAIQENNWVNPFPWSTFTVNILGCLAIGFIYGLLDRGFNMSEELKLFLTVGFCGGFTTFSTFINENFQMMEASRIGIMAAYAGISVIAGLLCVYLGHICSKSLL